MSEENTKMLNKNGDNGGVNEPGMDRLDTAEEAEIVAGIDDEKVEELSKIKGISDDLKGCAWAKPMLICTAYTTLNTLAGAMVAPEIPFLMQDYFGGGDSGTKMAATAQTTADTIRAVLAFLFVPIYGKFLDSIGRHPFFILSGILGSLPYAFLFAIPRNPLWYLGFLELQKFFSGAYTGAFIMDHYGEKSRGIVLAVSNGVPVLFLIPTALFANLEWELRVTISVALMMARIPIGFFLVKESLSRDKRVALSSVGCAEFNPNPLPVLRIVLQNKVMKTIIAIITSLLIAVVASSEIVTFYLIDKIGWTAKDSAFSQSEMGIMIPLGLLVFYPLVGRVVQPPTMVALCFVFLVLANVGLILVAAPWMVFVLINPLLIGIEMGVPALVAVFANAGEQTEQGKRLAGFYAVVDIVSALTPFTFGQIFYALPKDQSYVIYIICTILLLPGLFISLCYLPKVVREDKRQVAVKSAITSAVTSKQSFMPDSDTF